MVATVLFIIVTDLPLATSIINVKNVTRQPATITTMIRMTLMKTPFLMDSFSHNKLKCK